MLLLTCALVTRISISLQAWRHHPASGFRGQQAAVDGGNGWKRTCMNALIIYPL